MAEEKIVIKVEFKGDTTQIEKSADAATQAVDKIKKSADDSAAGFGIMDTKLGGMWKTFKSGGDMAVKSMTTLKGAIAATGIGLLVIAVAGLVQWFKQSETGSDLLAQGMKTLGQVVRDGPIVVFKALKLVVDALLLPIKTIIEGWKAMADVISGKKGIKEATSDFTQKLKDNVNLLKEDAQAVGTATKNLVEHGKAAWALEGELDAIDDDRRKSLKKTKELEQTIAEGREKASDIELSRVERLKALNTVLQAVNEKYDIEEGLLQRELEAKKKDLAMNADNLQMKLDIEAAENALIDVQTARAKERKNISRQINTIEKQETADTKKELDQRAKDQAEADENLRKLIELDDKLREEARVKKEQAEADFWLWELEMGLKRIENEKKRAEEAKQIALDEYVYKKEIQLAQLDLLAQFGEVLSQLAGKNRAVAYAGLLIQKAAAIGSIVANTAIANAKMVAALPITGGMPWVAINTASAALSIVSLVAQTAKSASEINSAGKEKKALGGWLGGASHQDGGVTVNAEGGEFMVNKRTMANPQMAQAITSMNAIGNGGNGSVGMLTEERVAEIASKVVGAIPVYVVEKEMTGTQRKVQVRESRFVR